MTLIHLLRWLGTGHGTAGAVLAVLAIFGAVVIAANVAAWLAGLAGTVTRAIGRRPGGAAGDLTPERHEDAAERG